MIETSQEITKPPEINDPRLKQLIGFVQRKSLRCKIKLSEMFIAEILNPNKVNYISLI